MLVERAPSSRGGLRLAYRAGMLCSSASRERHEAIFATASTVTRWLLVERPGRWGSEAVPLGALNSYEAQAAEEHMRAVGARLLLIRRPAGRPAEDGQRAFLVDSTPTRERVRTLKVADEEEARAVLLAGPRAGRRANWQPYEGRLFLVCTHGKHDACCAIRGRPVARAFAEYAPDRTWECTHVGGRFAANVVVLPEGLYLGHVTRQRVPEVLAHLADHRLPPQDLVRGRSSMPLPVQAAQHFARSELGLSGLRDLLPLGTEPHGDGVWQVALSARDRTATVTVRRVLEPAAHQLTCGASTSSRVQSFTLVSLSLD